MHGAPPHACPPAVPYNADVPEIAVSLGFNRVPQARAGAGAGGSATMHDPTRFQVVTPTQRTDVRTLTDVQAYLQGVTLEALLAQLKEHGITQKAFAEQIGMHTRHLAAIKSSE